MSGTTGMVFLKLATESVLKELFAKWFLQNIMGSIENKKFLDSYPTETKGKLVIKESRTNSTRAEIPVNPFVHSYPNHIYPFQ